MKHRCIPLLILALAAGLASPAWAGPPGPAPTAPAPVLPATPPRVAAPPATTKTPAPSEGPAPRTEVQQLVDHRDQITLAEVFDLLKARSPTYKAVESDIEVAKSDVKQARVLPNPILNLSILYLNIGFNQNGVATYYANATLPLLIAGQRRMRVKTAEVGVKATEADVKATYHELAEDARELFVELQADQRRIAVLEEALAELARLHTMIAMRGKSGHETRYDILRIDVETSVWQARLADEEAEAHDDAGRLGVLLGMPQWHPRAAGELGELGVRGDADAMWPDVERTQPGVVAARRAEAWSAQSVDLIRRERWPVPAVTVGTVAIQNYYSISTSAGITVPIPVFDWGQGMLAQAKARSQRARLQKEAVVASTRAELERALRLVDHRRRALRKFEDEVLVQLGPLQAMSESGFRDGAAQLIDLLDATRSRFELKLTQVDFLEATVQAEVDVLAVTGRIEQLTPGVPR